MQEHHKFSQHKRRRKKYGKLIDHPANIQIVTEDDHMSGRVERLSEREFCEAVGILDCKYCAEVTNLYQCLWFYGLEASECRQYSYDKSKNV